MPAATQKHKEKQTPMHLLEFFRLLIPEIQLAVSCLLFIVAVIVGSVLGYDSCKNFFVWFAVVYVTGVAFITSRFEFVVTMLLSKCLFGYNATYVTGLCFSLQDIFSSWQIGCSPQLLQVIPAVILITTGSIGLGT
jgi:hypothetical protein